MLITSYIQEKKRLSSNGSHFKNLVTRCEDYIVKSLKPKSP